MTGGASALAEKRHQTSPLLDSHGQKLKLRMWVESDPDGRVTEHGRVVNHRTIDALLESNLISPLQHQAGTELRDIFERTRLSMGRLGAVDPERPHTGGDGSYIKRDEEAWQDYITAQKQLKGWWSVLRFVVIEDGGPEMYGKKWRCHGIGELRSGLDAAVKHFGLIARRRS